MLKRFVKKIRFISIVISLLVLQINSVSAQGILIINSDYIEEDNTYIFDADDSGGDIELRFGASLGEYLKWDSLNNTFKFSDDLDLSGNQLTNFRIDNLASAPACDSLSIGRAYFNTSENNSYICNGTDWEQIDAGGGVSSNLAAVQARRTSNFTLSNQDQWYDVPLDSTDVETDNTVIEHDNTNTERINIKEDGVYRITYHIDALDTTTPHGIQARLRINNSNDVPGSFLETTNYTDEHQVTPASVIDELSGGDYIALQVQRLTSNTVIGEPLITVVKLEGVKGEKGDKGDPGSAGTGTDSETFTIDQDDTGGDLKLQFGNSLNEYLQWNDTAQAFILSDDLILNFNELKQFKIENSATALTCNSGYTGRAYYNTANFHTYICDGSTWVQIDNTASVTDTLAGVQARRTTNFSLTNQNQWYDIPLDSTDVETDSTVIEHNNTNTERIDIKADGLYRLTYHLDADDSGVTHDIQGKLRLNNTTDIPGSFLESTNYQGEHSPLTGAIIAELSTGDYVTLQAQRLTANTIINETLLTVVKMDGIKGDEGIPGPTYTPTVGLFYDSSGGVDLNVSTSVAIPFNQEVRKDSGYTHDNVTNNSRITLDEPGWYEVSYNVSTENQTMARKNIRCAIVLDGSTLSVPSDSYSYSRNTTNEWATNSATTLIQTTSSNQYYEIFCRGEGSGIDSASANTIADQSWTIVEKK